MVVLTQESLTLRAALELGEFILIPTHDWTHSHTDPTCIDLGMRLDSVEQLAVALYWHVYIITTGDCLISMLFVCRSVSQPILVDSDDEADEKLEKRECNVSFRMFMPNSYHHAVFQCLYK